MYLVLIIVFRILSDQPLKIGVCIWYTALLLFFVLEYGLMMPQAYFLMLLVG